MLDNLKQEILQSISTDTCCSNAFLSAVISLTKVAIDKSNILIDCPLGLQEKTLLSILNFYPSLNIDTHKTWFRISGKDVMNLLQELNLIDFDAENFDIINGCNENLLNSECCRLTYLKSVFLCAGKLYYNSDSSLKSNGYSLELIFRDYQLADDVFALTKYLGINLKRGKRNNNVVLYTKDSQVIVEILVKLGAVNGAFELQNSLVMREIRNDANRKGNCFDANLNKTINASTEQVRAIDYIITNYGLDYLDDNLKEVALLRLANPESTLSELQQLYSAQITRAGLKYKLDKILSIYKDLKDEN